MGVNYNTRIVTDGLVGCWDFGNRRSYPGSGSTLSDISGRNNTATLLNSPTFINNNGGGLSFNSASSHSIDAGNGTSLQLSNTFTVSAWIYWNGTRQQATILSKRKGSSNFSAYTMAIIDSFYVGGVSNKIGFWARHDAADESGTTDVNLQWPLALAGFYNVVAVMSPSNQYLYVNNVLVASSTKNLTGYTYNIPSASLVMGNTFTGNIYQVSVYNKALSASEVSQNYNATKRRFTNLIEPETYRAVTTINRSGLILELDAANTSSYPGTGTTWFDISGSGTNFTLVNGPTFDSVNGKGSINFAGDNDYAVGGSMPTGTNPFTLNWWIYLNSNISGTFGGAIYAAVLASGSSVGAIEVLLYTQAYVPGPPYRIAFSRYGGGTTGNISDAPTYVAIQTWNNFTLVRDGSASEIAYLNGRRIGTLDISNSFTSASIYLGGAIENASFSGYLNGKIGCFHQYNRALSDAEVYSNFNALRGRYGI